jgi:hypothetical protein
VNLWFLGSPDQACARAETALVLAREIVHPMSLTQALYWTAWLYQLRREEHAAQERLEEIGQAEAGLHVLAEALTVVSQHAEHCYEAELHRLQGELLLRHAVFLYSTPHCPLVRNATDLRCHALLPIVPAGGSRSSALRVRVLRTDRQRM